MATQMCQNQGWAVFVKNEIFDSGPKIYTFKKLINYENL